MALPPTKAGKPASKPKPQVPVPGTEPGDHVYVNHPKHGPMAVRVTSHGADGFRAEGAGKRFTVPWDRYLGHQKRMLSAYNVVQQGADGAVLEDARTGKRRYLAGQVPIAEPAAAAAPAPLDDPLLGGLDRLAKGAGLMLPDDACVLFFKGGQIANRAGLALKDVTDKAGHHTKRWERTQEDQPAQHDGPKHGDTVQFQHANVRGEGKIVASGQDGVTVQDKGGREHQVRHEHLVDPKTDQPSGPAPAPQAKPPGDPAAQAAGAAPTQAKPAAAAAPAGAQPSDAAAAAAAAAPPDPPPLFQPADVDKLPAKVPQPTKDEDELYAKSTEALEHLHEWLNRDKGVMSRMGFKTVKGGMGSVDWSEKGGMLFIAPLKGKKRAKEKVEADYGGDWSQLRDVVRCSVAVDSIADLKSALAELQKNGLKLAMKPKDRFHKPVPCGYRDLLMNVEFPNGVIGEVQLHVKPMLAAKSEGHHFYEVERSIASKPEEEWTPEEKAKVEDAHKQQQSIYGRAWAAAAGGSSGGESMSKAMAAEGGYDYLDHDGATFRRRKGKVGWSVDDVLHGKEWKPYTGDRLEVGANGDLLDGDPTVGSDDMRKAEPPVLLFIKAHEGPSPDAKHFYVSAIDGKKRHLVAGPYASHEAAKGAVEHVRRHADSVDPRAHFMAWGTAGSATPIKTPLGENWAPA